MAENTNIWNGLGRSEKLGLMLGVIMILGFAVAAYFWIYNERYTTLFADLQPNDAAKIVEELKQLKVDYQIANQGASIMVPENTVYDTRLSLMASGLPLSGGIGFELFDNTEFGMTEFAQRINYQRALQGELTRTIMALEEVKFARVHLAIPDKSLFSDDDRKASASVTLFLANNQRPDAKTVSGVQRLIAAAVPELNANQVTVSDEKGKTLSVTTDEQSFVTQVSTQLQKKVEVETYMMQKVNEVLNHTFGTNQAMVSIDVTLDFNQVKTTKESLEPLSNSDKGIIRRRESKAVTDAKDKQRKSNITTEEEYEHGRTIEQIVETPGRIARLGVGIVVPHDVTIERLQAIKDLVTVAVGFDVARGDQVAISRLNPPTLSPQEMHAKIPEPSNEVGLADMTSMKLQGNSGSAPKTFFTDINQKSLLFGTVVGGIGILVIWFLVALFRKPRTYIASTTLSDYERARVLQQIEEWLKPQTPVENGKSN